MHPYDVLIEPVLSEKSNRLREAEAKYTFEVLRTAGKNDVKKAVEKMFEVKVECVRTMLVRGKIRRRGMHYSKPVTTKRAIVTLAEGQKISLFEDQ